MRLDQMNGLIALATVAEKQSFTQAALELRVSPSAVSQAIKQLESRLGVALLSRTTRSVNLTEAGGKFLSQCGPALKEVMNAVTNIEVFAEKPSGNLRINLPRAAYPGVIQPKLLQFRKKYPEISLELFFDDEMSDIVEGGFDAGIRMSELVAKDMVATRISEPFRFVVAGAPKYFAKSGTPKTPQDLLKHECIRYRYLTGEYYERWEFEHRKKGINVQVKGTLIVNDPILMAEAAIQGFGLIYHTEDSLRTHLERRDLELVLLDYAPKSEGYFLYYPSRGQVLPKLRAFIDFFKPE